MIFDHEHQHPPSTAPLGPPSTWAKLAIGASLIAVCIIILQSASRVLW